MSSKVKKKKKRSPGETERGHAPSARSAALILGSVGVIVVLGFLLKTDAPLEAVEPLAIETPAPTPEPAAASAPEPLAVDPSPAGDPLADRAVADLARLRAAGGFTLQLAVVCDATGAQGMVDAGGGASGLYLLPALIDGRSCYRVCWGAGRDAETARRAADLPAALRAKVDLTRPYVRDVAELEP